MPTMDQLNTQKNDAQRQLDLVQENLMSASSSDGRPPPTVLLRNEWRWFAIGGVLVFAALLVWMVVSRASMGSVVAGVAYLVLLLSAASPVLGAGLLRGREERAAHKVASDISHHEQRDSSDVQLADPDEPDRRVDERSGHEVAPVVVMAGQVEFHEPNRDGFRTTDADTRLDTPAQTRTNERVHA